MPMAFVQTASRAFAHDSAHLSDVRRPCCRTAIWTNGFAKFPQERVLVLDEQDRLARREAFRMGHSHPIATRPAANAAGTTIGMVQQ